MQSSTIIEDAAQADGRRWIRERHIDNAGAERLLTYLANAADDAASALAAHAAALDADLTASEIAANVAAAYEQRTPVTKYSTVAQFRAALRAAYKVATGWDAVRLGNFIFNQALTDTQLKALFGINDAQLVTLKALLQAQHDRYTAAIADQGS